MSGNIVAESYNLGNINVDFNGNGEQTLEIQVGGVCGNLIAGKKIVNCYNMGNVTAIQIKSNYLLVELQVRG